MNFYKTYKLKKHDIQVQLSITIPRMVINHLKLKEGDKLRLTVEKDKLVIRQIKTKK